MPRIALPLIVFWLILAGLGVGLGFLLNGGHLGEHWSGLTCAAFVLAAPLCIHGSVTAAALQRARIERRVLLKLVLLNLATGALVGGTYAALVWLVTRDPDAAESCFVGFLAFTLLVALMLCASAFLEPRRKRAQPEARRDG